MHHNEDKKEWLEDLKGKLQTCPHCGQRWLIIGVKTDEEHSCRTCGNRFIINLERRLNGWPPEEQQCDIGKLGLLQPPAQPGLRSRSNKDLAQIIE